ncbi:MAG: serine/threonine protein kinase [Lentisphaeria bacterium]|nr:serine/threonine protein kinase [Lentisphaeria bacterium]
MSLQTFSALSPMLAVDMVEEALGIPVEAFVRPCPSHINRVYEMNTRDGLAFIVKFYRPGRWTEAAIRDEHDFMLDCQDAEIPVVAPAAFADGDTLAQRNGIFFAVFPKMGGFPFDSTRPDQWQRLGSLIGRVHAVGEQADARHRVILHPAKSSIDDFDYLRESDAIPLDSRSRFLDAAWQVINACQRAFPRQAKLIRIHGDCHSLNILDNPNEGLLLIDFDDMVVGPPVQDLWMLLPDAPENCRPLINAFLKGYRIFRDFDERNFRLIEPLRAMKMLYFLAWCARQRGDANFNTKFPDWHSRDFWTKQTADFELQLRRIR